MWARENYPLFSFFLDHQLTTKGRLITYIGWTCRLMTVCWSHVASRQHLRSVDTRKLVFWQTRMVLGARDFAVFCAVVWNSLSTDLRVFITNCCYGYQTLNNSSFFRPSTRFFCPFCASEDYLFCAIIFILCYKRNMHYCYLLLLCISGKWMFCVCEPCTGCSCSVFDLFRCQKWWRNSKNSSQILMFEPRFVGFVIVL